MFIHSFIKPNYATRKLNVLSQVDFDSMVEENRFVVKPGVDAALDDSRLHAAVVVASVISLI